MASKLKKGDKVFILAGKDKGKEGEIIQILGSDKAIVQGINLVKKHKKPSTNANSKTQTYIPISYNHLTVTNKKNLNISK